METDAQRLLSTLGRHRAWLAAPLLLTWTAGTAGVFLWPDTYVSSAAIRVTPPSISSQLVGDPITVSVSERVATLQQSATSRTALVRLIENFGLYPGERRRLPMEDLAERMRRDITVTPAIASSGGERRQVTVRIAFGYPDRFDAQRVTREIVSRFVAESQAERQRVLDSANLFLRDDYDRASAESEAAGARLAEARRRSGRGGAAGSEALTLQRLAAAESRGAANRAAMGRARQEGAIAEGELRAARERVASAAVVRPVELERLEARYKPNHPEVLRVRKELDAVRLRVAPAPAPEAPPSALPVNREPVVRAEAQVRAKAMELARLDEEAAELSRETRSLQAALSAPAPDHSVELEQLVREHELTLQRSRDARRKLLESEHAQKSNRWQLGETLDVVDGASLPELPVAPNRPLVSAVAALIGLAVGFGLVFLRESREDAIWTLHQLRDAGMAKVLGAIPLLEDALVVRRRRRTAVVGWASASLLSLMTMAGAVIYHHYGRR